MNNTPPTCIQCNIVSIVETISPHTVIKNVLSISTIHRGRTILYVAVCALAVYRLGTEKEWNQLFINGTACRKSSKNLSIAIKYELCDLLPILLTTNIIPKSKESKTVTDAIFEATEMNSVLSTQWEDTH